MAEGSYDLVTFVEGGNTCKLVIVINSENGYIGIKVTQNNETVITRMMDESLQKAQTMRQYAEAMVADLNAEMAKIFTGNPLPPVDPDDETIPWVDRMYSILKTIQFDPNPEGVPRFKLP